MAELLSPGSRVRKSVGAIDIFISGLNGSDANDGSSPSSAFKTGTKFVSVLPDIIDQSTHFVRARFGDAGGTPYAFFTIPERAALRASIFLEGDGAGQAGEDGWIDQTGVGSAGTADASSSTEKLVFGAGGMTVNAFRDAWIVFDTGPNVGDERKINENTATDFIPSRPFRFAPTGDYRIVRPRAIIAAPDPGQVLIEGGRNLYGQAGTAIDPGSPTHWLHKFGFDASAVAAFASTIVCRDPCNFYAIDTGFSATRINVELNGGGIIGVGDVAASKEPVAAGLITDMNQWDGNGWGAELGSSFLEISGGAPNGFFDPNPIQCVVVGHVLAISDAALVGGDLRRTLAAGNSPLLTSGRATVFGPSSTLPVKIRAIDIAATVGSPLVPGSRETCGFAFVDIDASDPAGVAILNHGTAILRFGSYTALGVGVHNVKGRVEFAGAATIAPVATAFSFDGSTGFPVADLPAVGDSVDNGRSTFQRVV